MESVPSKPKEWTILVYMSSDNDLSGDCIWALTEIQKSNIDNQIAVVAQFDPPGPAVGTKQYDFSYNQELTEKIGKDEIRLEHFEVDLLTDDYAIESLPDPPLIRRPVEEDFSSPNVLEAFLRDGIKRYKANHYLVVLSGYGNGVTSGLLTDENPPNSMSVPALKTALENTRSKFTTFLDADPKGEIDILGLDSCLMGMVEVASELTGTVRYLVASEGTTPASGWPYRQILENMQPNDPETVAINILDNFIRFYRDYAIGGVSVDQAVCNLAKIKAVETAVQELVMALTDTKENGELTLKIQYMDRIILAHWKAQAYRFEQHVDLVDFCACLKEGLSENEGHADVLQACERVKDAINAAIVKTNFTGAEFQYSHGLSVYFPWAQSQIESIREYETLLFPQRTKWGAFLAAYVMDTQRKMNGPVFKNQRDVYPQDVLFLHRDNPRLNQNREIPQINNNREIPQINNNREIPQINNNRDIPQINNNRDFIGGGGGFILAPKVKNPPSHFYRNLRENKKNSKNVGMNGHIKDKHVEPNGSETGEMTEASLQRNKT